MVRFSDDAEKVTSAQPGEYLFKIYEVNEKTSQAGNDYWQVKVESKDGVKVCDNLMFCGKAAGKTLAFLTALGLADGENFPTEEIHREDGLGGYLYIDVVKDKDSDFLKFPWSSNGYRAYEGKAKAKPKKEEVEEDIIPFYSEGIIPLFCK